MKLTQPLAIIGVLIGFSLPSFGEDKESIEVSEFTFKFGDPWVRQQVTSPMRAGQLTYDHEDEDLKDVDLVIYFFGAGQGGGIQANIDRWIGQFEGTPKYTIDKKDMGGREVTFLEASGTYMESMGGPFSGNKTSQPDYAMLAAILPSDQGAVFLKLTGPNDSVEALKEDFMAFSKSPFSE
jgi:hypothetical protein